jgi:dimethylargininase
MTTWTSADRVTRFNRALVRFPARSVTGGLRASDRGNPEYAGVQAEHEAYCAALERAGVTVMRLAALEDYPDSVFVEDAALVFTEAAVLLRPGAPTRRGETALIAPTLRELFHQVISLDGVGHADGGDVLVTPQRVLVGLSTRTNAAGAQALSDALGGIGRRAEIVRTPPGVLHFKSDCALLDANTVLCTRRLAAGGFFQELQMIIVPQGEEAAANALRINDVVLLSAGFPRTHELLERAGYAVVILQTVQIGRIDAGLSCMSLRWLAA